jgi:hypothetical protein
MEFRGRAQLRDPNKRGVLQEGEATGEDRPGENRNETREKDDYGKGD